MNKKTELLRSFALNDNIVLIEDAKKALSIQNTDDIVDELRAVGCDIKKEKDSYRFCPNSSIKEAMVASLLEKDNVRLHIFDELSSTNDTAMTMAQDANDEFTDYEVVIASHQTNGRGRRGRSFYSPEDTGLYMSITVRPQMCTDEVMYITAATAVALANAIEYATGCTAQIKWVNDIFVENKKTCGILTEASLDAVNNCFNYVVVGVGVNLSVPENGFPNELKDTAGALSEKTVDKSFFAAVAIQCFIDAYTGIRSMSFLTEYRQRQFILGKGINVIKADGTRQAVAQTVDDECRLVVEYPDGTTEALYSGEVSIRPVS